MTATQPPVDNELMNLAEAWVEADAMWENAAHQGTTDEQWDAEEKANAAKAAFATALSAQATEIAEAEDMAIADQKIIANLTAEVTQQAARLTAAEARIATMREALGRISKPGYGIEMGDDDAARADYWTKVALGYRDIASAAIRTTDESTAASGGE